MVTTDGILAIHEPTSSRGRDSASGMAYYITEEGKVWESDLIDLYQRKVPGYKYIGQLFDRLIAWKKRMGR